MTIDWLDSATDWAWMAGQYYQKVIDGIGRGDVEVFDVQVLARCARYRDERKAWVHEEFDKVRCSPEDSKGGGVVAPAGADPAVLEYCKACDEFMTLDDRGFCNTCTDDYLLCCQCNQPVPITEAHCIDGNPDEQYCGPCYPCKGFTEED